MALAASPLENQTVAGVTGETMKLKSGHTLPRAGVERILIRGTNWIGDAVMTLPALSAVSKTYPEARTAILVKPWVADIYRLCPHVDEVILYERPGIHDGTGGILRLARELKAKNFHLAVCLQNAIEAAIIARLAGIPLRAGYNSDGRGFLLTHAVRRTEAIRKVHQRDYYLAMVRALGCEEGEGGPYLRLSAEDGRSAEQLLRSYGIGAGSLLVGLAPGATYGPAKKWFPERFAALADRLKEEFPAQIILFGSDADKETTKAVQQAARQPFIDLAGKTNLRMVVSLIALCRLFVSNDSGLMHVAGALNIPTIAVFGSTNPITTAPLGEKSVIIYKGVECSPCLKETCPTDFRCMEMIETEEVVSTARALLWR